MSYLLFLLLFDSLIPFTHLHGTGAQSVRHLERLSLKLLHYPEVVVRVGAPCTEDLTANFLHPSLSSASFKASPSFRPVHSRMLSSHLFLCLPLIFCSLSLHCTLSWQALLTLLHAHTTSVCVFHRGQAGGH